MDSTTFLLLTCLLIALLAALYLHTNRRLQQDAERQANLVAATLELQTGLLERERSEYRELREEQQERDQQNLERILQATLSQMEKTVHTVDLMATRATSGSHSSLSQVTEALSAAVALLGAKDPIAYQMIRGAAPLPDSGDLSPYPAADEVAERQAKAEQDAQALAELEKAQQMLEGLVNGGSDIFGAGTAGADAGATA